MKKISIIELKQKAQALGLAMEKTAKKADIIRSIQTQEGNNPCFKADNAETCNQDRCCWRPDCLG